MKHNNLIGLRFGKLVVINQTSNSKFGKVRWICECDCGKTTIVIGSSLQNYHTKSCGCFLHEFKFKHGHARKRRRSKTYESWYAMMQRCVNQNTKDWKNYGGRGIKVCKRWHKFENFLADMGERPKGKTLDRYPNKNGDYRPSNCRWATRKQQASNRR